MADWGPVIIGVVLFILLQPGLLFSLPGNGKQVEFGSMKTNGKAIAVHTLIFFALYAILILAVHVHIYTGWSGTLAALDLCLALAFSCCNFDLRLSICKAHIFFNLKIAYELRSIIFSIFLIIWDSWLTFKVQGTIKSFNLKPLLLHYNMD